MKIEKYLLLVLVAFVLLVLGTFLHKLAIHSH
jgi:TRAP-type C4-dicarboxylate transport system permease large subunit